MFRKKRLFILIPTLLLIPLLLAMTPLKIVNKLSHAGPLAQSQSKQGCSHKNCFSQSLISQNYFDAATVDAKSSDHEVSYLLKAINAVPEPFHSNIHITSNPLRC
jgi:hypothetical protein